MATKWGVATRLLIENSNDDSIEMAADTATPCNLNEILSICTAEMEIERERERERLIIRARIKTYQQNANLPQPKIF